MVKLWEPAFDLLMAVSPKDIARALSRAAPWKALGEDGLPMGLLKACGKPLNRVLATLTEASLRLGWFFD